LGALRESTAKPSDLGTRERNTLLKLIMGMAIACYSHDPLANRTSTATAITGDLHTVGIDIDDETVRKWLREAREFAPPPDVE
jgi:hypothetical protein